MSARFSLFKRRLAILVVEGKALLKPSMDFTTLVFDFFFFGTRSDDRARKRLKFNWNGQRSRRTIKSNDERAKLQCKSEAENSGLSGGIQGEVVGQKLPASQNGKPVSQASKKIRLIWSLCFWGAALCEVANSLFDFLLLATKISTCGGMKLFAGRWE